MTLNVIQVYKDGRDWFFDDKARSAKHLPLAKAGVVLDRVAKDKGKTKFDIIFDNTPFLGASFRLERRYQDDLAGWANYAVSGVGTVSLGIEWLADYFPSISRTPQNIYAKAV